MPQRAPVASIFGAAGHDAPQANIFIISTSRRRVDWTKKTTFTLSSASAVRTSSERQLYAAFHAIPYI